MNKAQLYKKVLDIKTWLGIHNNDYPLDIFEICSNIPNIQITTAPFKTRGLRGMLSIAENNDENHVILVNSNKSNEEQNYHGTHEFMHIFCDESDGTKIFSCFDEIKPNQNPYIEWFANEGAAEFLVGYKTFIPLFSDLCNVFTYNYDLWRLTYGEVSLTQELANRFAVSEIVIKNRISNLSYEIDQYKDHGNVDKIIVRSNSELKRFGITATDYVGNIKLAETKQYFEIPKSINTLRI